VKKPWHIVTRAGREPATMIEQCCRADGQILLRVLSPLIRA
jgi:hypothetical protein